MRSSPSTTSSSTTPLRKAIRRRRSLTGPDGTARRSNPERVVRAQSPAGPYLAEATLAMVSLALPHAAQVDEAAIAELAGIACVVSARVPARFDRLTVAEIDACVVGGAPLTVGAACFTHAEGGPYALFFVWAFLEPRAVESLISAAVVADIPYM